MRGPPPPGDKMEQDMQAMFRDNFSSARTDTPEEHAVAVARERARAQQVQATAESLLGQRADGNHMGLPQVRRESVCSFS